jgi:peptidylprolyl isomerase
MRPSHLISALALVLALAVAGCGTEYEDKRDSAASNASAADTTETTTEAKEPPKEVSKDLKTKPEIPTQSGEPPAELQTKDIVVGKGKEAKKGDDITVEYVGTTFSTGTEFDTSWGKQPFPFKLGGGDVIDGWDEGIVGMKPGGRRQLTIPPDKAYGEAGSPPTIGPNETLVFVVDLKSIDK